MPQLLRTLVIAAPLAAISSAAFAQACATLDDMGKFKNTFVCPVKSGAKIRPSDACAPNGGGSFRAGREGNRYHNALDMNAAEKTDVLATKPGKIAVADANFGKMGAAVIIDHEDGDYSVYGHLNEVKAKKGACVKAGDLIGTVGFTGNGVCLKEKGLSAHLHFAVIRAAQMGLADVDKPIGSAVKNGNDWLELAKEIFPGDNLDLGIKDPELILTNVAGCLK
ncbi:M23 family metallopeptidase [Microvirga pakistanensis]|uniref:M23 family metallopeptidase n=1 Tax=Microvirga pakistanensis TaxID=1682650 RepID=UPI00106C7EEB|nr:M23 family metallopeptidase [Microvirga pakistanensis]